MSEISGEGVFNEQVSRRTVLKTATGAAMGALVPGLLKSEPTQAAILQDNLRTNELEVRGLSRKEHFRPFENSYVQWQYVQFQYEEDGNRIGITTSFSEAINPRTNEKTHQLLVMKHNLDSGESTSQTYDGTLAFNNDKSRYTFVDKNGQERGSLSYLQRENSYRLILNTDEFQTADIDQNGLILDPQGNLIPVSGGEFTVADYGNGRVKTRYFADNIIVRRSNGRVVGFGRRDSENLEVDGGLPSGPIDIDHTWIHTCVELENGDLAFVTGWKSSTGGNFRFADVMIIDQKGKVRSFKQWDEKNGLNMQFVPNKRETETVGDSKMSHGGTAIASIGNKPLFEMKIKGDPGQIINGKGSFDMVEAHGEVVDGVINRQQVKESKSAIWESTLEQAI